MISGTVAADFELAAGSPIPIRSLPDEKCWGDDLEESRYPCRGAPCSDLGLCRDHVEELRKC